MSFARTVSVCSTKQLLLDKGNVAQLLNCDTEQVEKLDSEKKILFVDLLGKRLTTCHQVEAFISEAFKQAHSTLI